MPVSLPHGPGQCLETRFRNLQGKDPDWQVRGKQVPVWKSLVKGKSSPSWRMPGPELVRVRKDARESWVFPEAGKAPEWGTQKLSPGVSDREELLASFYILGPSRWSTTPLPATEQLAASRRTPVTRPWPRELSKTNTISYTWYLHPETGRWIRKSEYRHRKIEAWKGVNLHKKREEILRRFKDSTRYSLKLENISDLNMTVDRLKGKIVTGQI